MNVAVMAATDPGIKRELNEDSYACWIPTDPQERERLGVLLVLADGMGGARAGEVASRLAVNTVVKAYREASEVSGIDALRHAVESANRAVHDENRLNPGLRQMGTTCTAAAICGDDLLLAHVGDCRAYRISERRVEQLTRDHSLVALLVEQKTLTPEQARVDPRRNLITRSLGQNSEVKVDATEFRHALGAGDTLLLCSDGLYGLVEEEELAQLVDTPDLDGVCRDLVSVANERGGPDNITILLARCAEPESERPTARPHADIWAEEPALPHQYPAWLLALILVAVVLAVYAIVSLTSG